MLAEIGDCDSNAFLVVVSGQGYGDRTVDEMGHAWVDVTCLTQGDFDREYDRSLIAVLAWADVLEPRLKGRSTHWYADAMLAVVGDDDEERDRVVEALGLACDGKVLDFLVGEEGDAEELREEPRGERRLEYSSLAVQETEGARSFGS